MGKTHDGFNFLLGAIYSGVLLGYTESASVFLSFSLGWLYSSFIFHPDSDLLPKKQAGWLRPLLYPYSMFFKHRGISHSFLFGTLTRIIYTILAVEIVLIILWQMGASMVHPFKLVSYLQEMIFDFNSARYDHRLIIIVMIGMYSADIHHFLLDHVSTLFKKFVRSLKRT